MSTTAEIIVVGNEILLGDVLDTNSHWLCSQLTGLGGDVRRVCQIRDELQAIERALRQAIERDANLIITTGGLGPTDDDLTLKAVAQALGRDLRLHPLAYEWVSAKYEELARQGYVDSPEMTPSRAKMAHLPSGAEPLANDVGAAPGVLLREQGCTLVSLPGVPAELKDIFQGALRPTLTRLLGEGFFQEWKAQVGCGDESVLSPLLRDVTVAHPAVYVKSRAKRFGPAVQFMITLSARGQNRDQVDSLLGAAWQALHGALAQAGIDVISVEQACQPLEAARDN